MVNVFRKFLVRLASIAINLQLVISPMALAQNSKPKQTRSNFWDKAGQIAQTVTKAVGMGMQLIDKNQSYPPMQNHLLKTVNPVNIPPALQAAGCLVYEAKGSVPPSDQICSPQKAKLQSLQMTMQLYATAKQNANDLDNYLINGNESKTSQGAACLNKAMFTLQAQLKARVEQLNQFEKLVENTFKTSKKLMEKDLKNLHKGNALLNGKSKDPENSLADFDFGKQFKSKACASFITESDLGKSGNEGGYRAIESLLSKNFETSSGEGKYSAKELFGQQDKIKQDINGILSSMEDNITNEATATFEAKDLMDGAQTSTFSLKNKALENVVKNELKTYSRQLKARKKQLLKIVDEDSLKKIEDGTNSSSDIAQIFRRDRYNKCLQGYVGDSKSFAKSITNFSLTKSANSDRDSLLRSKVYDNLMDGDIDIDQKIANISQFDTAKSERIRMGSSQKLCGKTIYADTRISVSSLMSLYKCECEKQYNNKTGGSLSAQESEEQLANYSNYVSTEKGKLFNGLATKIKNKVLNCPEDSSTGQGALTCGDALSKDSQNFCLRTANICAGNMKACFDEANNMMVKTRAEQKVIATRYNANMDKLKLNLQQAFINNERQIEASSRTLDAQYQIGSVYKTPLNLKMDQLKSKFIKGLDDSLQVEDPDQYLEVIKGDIKLAKAELTKSNVDIFGSDPEKFNGLASGTSSTKGFLGKVSEYVKNAEREKARWEKIMSDCDKTIDRMNAMIQDQNKQTQDRIAKENERKAYMRKKCEIFANGCEDSQYQSLGSDVFGAAEALTGSVKKDPFKELCTDGKSTDDDYNRIAESTNFKIQHKKITSFCKVPSKIKNSDEKEDCEAYNKASQTKIKCSAKDIATMITEISKQGTPLTFCVVMNPDEEVREVTIKSTKECAISSERKTKKFTVKPKGSHELLDSDYKKINPNSIANKYCLFPKDYSIAADASYRNSANSTPEFSGYGESPIKGQCDSILARSSGSGDKDEYGAGGAGNFFNSLVENMGLMK